MDSICSPFKVSWDRCFRGAEEERACPDFLERVVSLVDSVLRKSVELVRPFLGEERFVEVRGCFLRFGMGSSSLGERFLKLGRVDVRNLPKLKRAWDLG